MLTPPNAAEKSILSLMAPVLACLKRLDANPEEDLSFAVPYISEAMVHTVYNFLR